MFDFLNGPYKYIAVAAIVALDLLFVIWGASLLYRGLDGDRITLKRPVKGRWTNSINLLMVFAGLVVLLVGAGLGWGLFVGATDDGSATNVLRSLVSVLVLTASIVMISWAWAGRRAAGKPRCPQCFYDVSATPGMICPECGYEAETPGHWHKPKKRKRWVIAGVLLSLFGLIGLQTNLISRNWRRVLPTTFLITHMDTLPEFIVGSPWTDWARSVSGFQITPAHPGSLFARMAEGELSPKQLALMTTTIENGIADSRSPEDLIYWMLSADYTFDTLFSVSFSSAEAEDFINMALLQERSRLPGGDLTWCEIDWQGFDALDEDVRADLALRLAQVAHESLDDSMIRVRWQVAFALHPDPEKMADQFIQTLTEMFEDSQTGLSEETGILTIACVEVAPQLISRRLFYAILEAEDPQARVDLTLLLNRAVTMSQRHFGISVSFDQLLSLSPSDRRVAVEILGRMVSQRIQDTGYRNISYSTEARAARSLLPYLVTLTEFDTLNNAIKSGNFTDTELAVLWAYATSPDTPILVTELLALTGHESDAVRAAVAYALASDKQTLSSYSDSIGDLIVQIRDYPGREDLLYDYGWMDLDSPKDALWTPVSDPDWIAIPDATAPGR